MSAYQTIVVPYDFSEHAHAALETSLDLARRLDSNLHLVHALQPPAYGYGYANLGGTAVGAASIPPPGFVEEMRAGAMNALREVAQKAAHRAPGDVVHHLTEGVNVSDAILQSARDLNADLIVMGTHGRTGIAHVFLGSVAERTLRRAPCPVLTVRAPETGSSADSSD